MFINKDVEAIFTQNFDQINCAQRDLFREYETFMDFSNLALNLDAIVQASEISEEYKDIIASCLYHSIFSVVNSRLESASVE